MKEFFFNLNPTVKGISLAFIATLGIANVYVFSKAAMLIQATRSLFVLVGSMIYLSILPEMLQLIGGLVTIVGVIVMTWGKMKFKKKAGP